MSPAGRSALVAVILLLVVGLLWPGGRATTGGNSFGTTPHGYGALFELLTALDLPVARSYHGARALPPDAVVWWIAPRGLCTAASAEDETARTPGWQARDWLEAGGTAVVFLPGEGFGVGSCESLGSFPLPSRRVPAVPEPEAEELGRFEEWWRGASPPGVAPAELRVTGGLVPRPRALGLPRLWRFAGDLGPGWTVRARVSEAGGGEAPFVLEQSVGAGRLVVVSDAHFLSNRWLDHADAAPLALDLVRAYGAPRLDERSHGLRAEQRPLVYLARSPALPVFAGLALLGMLAVWRGAALPRRSLAAEPAAPTLERFVDSLAFLYARTRDHARVAERYRELCVAQLRRHFGLPPDTPPREILARLERSQRLAPERLAVLRGEGAPVRSAAELRATVKRLDALVKEVPR